MHLPPVLREWGAVLLGQPASPQPGVLLPGADVASEWRGSLRC